MISGAIQILEQRDFQSSEAEVPKRDWVFDNEGDFASLYLADYFEVWAKSIHGSTSRLRNRDRLTNGRLVFYQQEIARFQLRGRRKDHSIACAQAGYDFDLISVDCVHPDSSHSRAVALDYEDCGSRSAPQVRAVGKG